MPRSRTIVDAADTSARLDRLAAAVKSEADGAESDPFDDAMVAAVVGIAEAMQADGTALAELEARLGRLARRALVSK